MTFITQTNSACSTARARRWTLGTAIALHRSRRDLARLSDAQLHDIGVSRRAALCEARRLPWDLPGHWTR